MFGDLQAVPLPWAFTGITSRPRPLRLGWLISVIHFRQTIHHYNLPVYEDAQEVRRKRRMQAWQSFHYFLLLLLLPLVPTPTQQVSLLCAHNRLRRINYALCEHPPFCRHFSVIARVLRFAALALENGCCRAVCCGQSTSEDFFFTSHYFLRREFHCLSMDDCLCLPSRASA